MFSSNVASLSLFLDGDRARNEVRRVKSIFEGGPWLNLSSSIKRKEIYVQDETTKPEEKGKDL